MTPKAAFDLGEAKIVVEGHLHGRRSVLAGDRGGRELAGCVEAVQPSARFTCGSSISGRTFLIGNPRFLSSGHSNWSLESTSVSVGLGGSANSRSV